ncbi:MAG: ComF family protein [Cyanobacteria bacterium J06636_16]
MWGQSFQAITNLFLQRTCPLCNRAAPQDFCPACWRQLQSEFYRQSATTTEAALAILASGSYQGTLKQAIAALKYDGNRHIALPLGFALGERWQAFPLKTRKPPLVVPIPLHIKKLRERGFNQAELLADAFCRRTGLTLIRRGLVRQQETTPQFGLGVAARQQNLMGAFTLGSDFQHRHPQQSVLLLDDIYTTGTTVRTAATVLRQHGISVCGVGAIAQATLDC